MGHAQGLKSVFLVVAILLAFDLAGRTVVRGARVNIEVNINTGSNQDTAICRNYDHRISNLTGGAFFCPDIGQPEHYTYCCGESGQQTCCGFWDDPSRKGWTIFGIVLSSVSVIGSTVIAVCKICTDQYVWPLT